MTHLLEKSTQSARSAQSAWSARSAVCSLQSAWSAFWGDPFSGVLKFPKGFSESTRPGSLQRIKMSRFRSITKGKVGWHYDIGGRNSIVVSVNKPIKLYAVRLFGSKNSECSVTLTVTDSNGVALVTKTGKFMSQRVQSERGDFPLSRV